MKTILCLVAAVALLAGCSKPASAIRVKWEYQTVEVENYEHKAGQTASTNAPINWQDVQVFDALPGGFFFDDQNLNKLGSDGWELVSSIPQIETMSDAALSASHEFNNIRTGKIILIFKRPLL